MNLFQLGQSGASDALSIERCKVLSHNGKLMSMKCVEMLLEFFRPLRPLLPLGGVALERLLALLGPVFRLPSVMSCLLLPETFCSRSVLFYW